jgi:acyl-CoA synthetase (AMP-forming)/AMP-acid ligase II
MLYEHWSRVAAERRNEIALRDFATGRRWRFHELRAAGEAWPIGDAPVVFPQGHSPEFLFALLAAWRSAKVVCPLEPGQPTPSLESAPPHCVHLKTTSGTTGAARFVAFTPEQLAADAENIMATMGLRTDWPNLGVISMAHSYGFSNLVLPLLLHGVPLILVPTPLPELVRRATESETAITLAAVPALWRAWHEVGAIPPNIRIAISAGAPLPVRLEEAVFKARGLKIHNFYGSSECGGIAYDATEVPRTDETCVGSPMKNVSLSVAGDSCLEVRSRAVAETYWPQSETNLTDGCFRTNDLAEISGGQVFLRGRAGDQINVAGRKVSPVTIEQALFQHPLVAECLVFGVPSRDAERTEEIVVVVVSRERESVLRQFLLESLPAWQVPRHWWFVEALLANPRGKISRAEWRDKFIHQRNQCV